MCGQFERFDRVGTDNAFAAVIELGFSAENVFGEYDQSANDQQYGRQQCGGIVVKRHFVFLENGGGKGRIVEYRYCAEFNQHVQRNQQDAAADGRFELGKYGGKERLQAAFTQGKADFFKRQADAFEGCLDR